MDLAFALDELIRMTLKVSGFQARKLQTTQGEIHFFEKKNRASRGNVVFVHGIGAHAGHYQHLMRDFARMGYSVFALDLLSHGKSSDPQSQLTPEVLFKSFEEWISQTVSGSFHLIGNSLGGAISLKYAITHPDRVSKLVLLSPAGGFRDESEWDEFRRSLLFQTPEEVKAFISKIYHRPPFYVPFLSGLFLKTMKRDGILHLIQQTALKDFDFRAEKIEKLPPTLLIWGKSEKVFPIHHLDFFRRILPPSVLIEEPTAISHCPQLDQPTWALNRIENFFKDPHPAENE